MARLTKKQEKSVLDGLTLMDDALFPESYVIFITERDAL